MKNLIVLPLLWVLSLPFSIAQTPQLVASQGAEYGNAKVILVHRPGGELSTAMLHPRAALYDRYFDITKATIEHKNYCDSLESSGARVYTLREVLLYGTVDSSGNNIEGAELEALRELAMNSLSYDVSELPEPLKTQQQSYKSEVIDQLNANLLVDLIINRPTLKLKTTEYNTGIAAEYIYNPLYNLFYTRDQMITTPKGVIIGKLNSPQRRAETMVMEFAVDKLGITPVHTISSKGAYLEGGDFVAMENVAFIGCGMRTTQQAIDELLECDGFGVDSVVVVHDRRFYQPQMHLDTYFNIIDRDLVTLAVERMTLDTKDHAYLSYTLYVKNNNARYKITQQDKPFVELLNNDLRVEIIPIAQSDQDHFANNFLTLSPRRIIAVANQSKEFREHLDSYGVDVIWVELENLILGYGAAHCMTQVLLRD